MADPMTMLMIGGQVLGGLQRGAAAEAQASAQIKAQQAQAAAARYNQQIADQNALITQDQTKAQLDLQDKQKRLRAGQSNAAAGASGIGADSFGDIMRDNAAQEELDLLTIESEGALKSNQYKQQGTLYGMSANSALEQIPYIKSAAKSSKAASIIGGVSGGLQSYSSMKGL